MQTRLRWMIVLGVGGLIAAGNALANPPRHGAAYSGTGVDYMNDHSGWTAEGMGAISFQTSSNGKAVTGFQGGYSFYCGSGTATVTEQRLAVSAAGTFGTKFTVANRGPSGKRNGTAYVEISGTFAPDRTSASISYLVDYVFKGRHVRHPYDTSRPNRLGCASWVRGTATMNAPSTGSAPQPQPHPHPQPHPGNGHARLAVLAARSRLLSS